MEKSVVRILVISLLLLGMGCSYQTGIVEYRKYNMYTAANAGNIKYEELLPIQESGSSFIWESCSILTSEIANLMFDRSKAAGGNALMNVKWFAENGAVTTPTCKTGYGWFLLYIVGGLGPWVKSATAEASIIKLNEEELKNTSLLQDLNIIPLISKQDFFAQLHL
ncbi:MAG: hypothetical protein HQM12_19490 [SAR324 cluster bacterium]|nr:hypothetical protein [SAR324 cluster bacterium]